MVDVPPSVVVVVLSVSVSVSVDVEVMVDLCVSVKGFKSVLVWKFHDSVLTCHCGGYGTRIRRSCRCHCHNSCCRSSCGDCMRCSGCDWSRSDSYILG